MIALQRFGTVATAPPLVVIPGIDGSIGSVQPIVEKLGAKRPIILVDYTQEAEPTLERLSAAIADILLTQVDTAFDLLGQSIGTILAAQLSVRVPPVRRVVLISTFLRLGDLKLRLSNCFASLSPRWLYQLLTPPTLAWQCGPVGDGRNHPFFARSVESDPSVVVKRTSWEVGRDFHQDISGIAHPLLVLMGQQDRFVPNAERELEELGRLLAHRNARVIAVPHAGHVFLPTPAIEFAAAQITEFLS
ncbi:alpha/beta hydrolase [Mesorhizobium sp.]|uniref:alpha/beta fold hydrolase n=1 Tax=Mesorhizobium sp. TaxID=1871066 RepID=UPI001216B59B|nr:alpha/beta hydrolase [Mesorhizobium sp.]TIP18459.1 MAG: alpha/beta hydrolase [Mesorhizobium sp.]